eukprot:SAG11_NODE_27866_length_328_cov_0.585153_1_plen_81_part_10
MGEVHVRRRESAGSGRGEMAARSRSNNTVVLPPDAPCAAPWPGSAVRMATSAASSSSGKGVKSIFPCGVRPSSRLESGLSA